METGSDLTPPEGMFEAPTHRTNVDFRGIGESSYKREPIAAVIEIMKRQEAGGGRWEFKRPFTPGVSDSAKNSFHILQPVTTQFIQRGSIKAPVRELHPSFAPFNTCHPDKSQIIRGKIVSWKVEDAFKYYVGAFKPPTKAYDDPRSGWWCRGDCKNALRYVGGKFKSIPCPGRKCEFQQERWGRGGKQVHCRPNMTLYAQFNWPDMPDGKPSPLPKVLFEFSSKAWHSSQNAIAMFRSLDEIAVQTFGMSPGEFPVLGLSFTMTLCTQYKQGRNFPVVNFSIDGDVMEYMSKIIQLKQNPVALDFENLPSPTKALPPAGYTVDDMQDASEACLSPNYKPRNER